MPAAAGHPHFQDRLSRARAVFRPPRQVGLRPSMCRQENGRLRNSPDGFLFPFGRRRSRPRACFASGRDIQTQPTVPPRWHSVAWPDRAPYAQNRSRGSECRNTPDEPVWPRPDYSTSDRQPDLHPSQSTECRSLRPRRLPSQTSCSHPNAPPVSPVVSGRDCDRRSGHSYPAV